MIKSRQRKITALTVIIFLLLAAFIIAFDWSQVQQIIGKAQWHLALLALSATFLSYFCLSFGYVLVDRVFGIGVGWWKLFDVGIVSATLNNILGFMGAAGHALRVELIKRRGVDAGEVLAASIFYSYLNNVMVLALLALGLGSLQVSHTVFGGNSLILWLIGAVLIVSLIISTAIIFSHQLKSGLLRFIKVVWYFFTHRDIMPFLNDLNHGLTHGLVALKTRPWELTLLLGLMAGEWAFTAAALWFCFAALGHTPNLGVLLLGFGIGLVAGNLSWVPGGLGVQEASMAGIYALFGMSFPQAVLACILFRVVYDFIPFLASLSFYGWLMRGT